MLRIFFLACTYALLASCNALTHSSPSRKRARRPSRRSVLVLPFVSLVAGGPPTAASALDMDAFVNQELSRDECDPRTSKKCSKALTDDEALCKFGQPSKERGDACVRAGQSTKLTKNGVDAYGKVDRGDFQRCKQFYELDDRGKYVKKTVCGLAPS